MLKIFLLKHPYRMLFFTPLFIATAIFGSQDTTLEQEFFEAVKHGNQSVYTMIESHPDLARARNSENETALHTIARNGDIFRTRIVILHWGEAADRIADFLLNNGAEVDARNQSDHTPLQIAARKRHFIVAAVLIQHGAEVNKLIPGGLHKGTLLHWAIKINNEKFAEMLVSAGADTNAVDINTCTPLHLVASGNYTSNDHLIDYLLRHGARIDCVDKHGNSPLHIAAMIYQSSHGVRALLRHNADVHAQNHSGETPLHVAAEQGNPDSVVHLLRYNADVTAQNHSGETPLHRTVNTPLEESSHGGLDRTKPILDRKNLIIVALLEAGADVNATTTRGKVPLHHAARESYVKKLVRHGADPNIKDTHGFSPYYHALLHNNLMVAFTLLKANPELDPPYNAVARQQSPTVIPWPDLEEFMQRCTTFDILLFHPEGKQRVRGLLPKYHYHNMLPYFIQTQAEIGSEILKFLNSDSVYSLTHAPEALNNIIVAYLISPEAFEQRVIRPSVPTRFSTIWRWLKSYMS